MDTPKTSKHPAPASLAVAHGSASGFVGLRLIRKLITSELRSLKTLRDSSDKGTSEWAACNRELIELDNARKNMNAALSPNVKGLPCRKGDTGWKAGALPALAVVACWAGSSSGCEGDTASLQICERIDAVALQLGQKLLRPMLHLEIQLFLRDSKAQAEVELTTK